VTLQRLEPGAEVTLTSHALQLPKLPETPIEKKLAGHALQAVAPAAEERPAGHVLQAVAPAVLKVFKGQVPQPLWS
jgi:hypothetical protein